MKEAQNRKEFSHRMRKEASLWIAKHERGLSAKEASEFNTWLKSNPDHEVCYFEQEIEWASLDSMDDWKPKYITTPNPDLFKRKRRVGRPAYFVYLGAAAIILLCFSLLQFNWLASDSIEEVPMTSLVAIKNERHFLEDGSSFYLRAGSEIKTSITDEQRYLHLVKGEAQFFVAKDKSRPFVVNSSLGKVTAIGTAFSVGQGSDFWKVYVTEGSVKVEQNNELQEKEGPSYPEGAISHELIAGERIIVPLNAGDKTSLKVGKYSDKELGDELFWKDQVIELVSAPISEIIGEFSRFDAREVLINDENIKHLKMSVSINSDNLDDFIDILFLSMDINNKVDEQGRIILYSQE